MYILKALLISLVTGSFQVLGSTTTGYSYKVEGIQSKFCHLPILSGFETSVRDQLCSQLCSQLAFDFSTGKIYQTKIESIIQPYGLTFNTLKPYIVQVAQEVKVPITELKFITATEISAGIFGDLFKKEEFTTYDAYTEFKNVEKLISLTPLKKGLSSYESSILSEYLTRAIAYKSIDTGDILRLCEANLIKVDSIQTGLLMLLKEIKQLIKDVEIDMTGYYNYIVNLPEVCALLVSLEPTIKGGNITQEKMMLAFSLYLNAKADAVASGKDLSKFELDFKPLASLLKLDSNSVQVNQMFAQLAPIEKLVIKAVPSAAIARIVKIPGSSVVSITDSETLQQNQYRYYLNTYLGQHDKFTPKVISTIFDQLKSTYSACKICLSVNSSLKQEAAIYVAAEFKTDTIRSLLDTSATLKFSSNLQFTEVKKKKAEDDKKKKEEEKKKAGEEKKKMEAEKKKKEDVKKKAEEEKKMEAEKKKKEDEKKKAEEEKKKMEAEKKEEDEKKKAEEEKKKMEAEKKKEEADKKKREEEKKKKEAEGKKKNEKEAEDKKKKDDEEKKKKDDEEKKKKDDEEKKKKDDEEKKKKDDEEKKKKDGEEKKKKDDEEKKKKDDEEKKKKDGEEKKKKDDEEKKKDDEEKKKKKDDEEKRKKDDEEKKKKDDEEKKKKDDEEKKKKDDEEKKGGKETENINATLNKPDETKPTDTESSPATAAGQKGDKLPETTTTTQGAGSTDPKDKETSQLSDTEGQANGNKDSTSPKKPGSTRVAATAGQVGNSDANKASGVQPQVSSNINVNDMSSTNQETELKLREVATQPSDFSPSSTDSESGDQSNINKPDISGTSSVNNIPKVDDQPADTTGFATSPSKVVQQTSEATITKPSPLGNSGALVGSQKVGNSQTRVSSGGSGEGVGGSGTGSS